MTKVELQRLKKRIDAIANNVLCDMKPGWDDSIEGFNKALDLVRDIFKEEADRIETPSEKIKYWWSEDRQWFCIMANDGVAQATVSLTVDDAERLMDQVMQTPRFLEFQKECADRALELLDEAHTASG